MSRKSGFTIIELMIVLIVIIIIVAIAVPNLLRTRTSANEAGATAGMRTISTGEAAYQATGIEAIPGGLNRYGTLTSLGTGEAPFIDPALASGLKEGYTFEAIPYDDGQVPHYAARAIPVLQNETGNKSYFVDETGVLRFTSDGSNPTSASPPIN